MTERDYDIVIVGSGAGGGAVAHELSPLIADGVRIAVLEAGPRLREEEYTGREVEMAERLYYDAGGMFTKDRAMTLAMGRAYGGSTVVYTGTSLKIPRRNLEHWGVPGLEFEDLDRRADKYLTANNVHLLEPDRINDNNRLFREACEKLGWNVEQFPVNVADCLGAGLCNLGCPNGAKQGTHRVQLPAAERAGVEVVTDCRVERIGDRELDVVVTPPGAGDRSAWEPGAYRVRARIVVVCAGAVHSPALLLRSGFGSRLPELGCWTTLHPALILVASHGQPITNYHGHPKSYYCDEFAESEGFLLETCMYFPFTTAKNLNGFGEQHSELLSRMDRLQMILVLALDPATRDNRVTVDRSGSAVVDYRISSSVIRSFVKAIRASARVFFAAGAERVHAPAASRFLLEARDLERIDELVVEEQFQLGQISVTSAHPMGGCRMGSGPQDSVTDCRGRVHGVPWLFVADSSLFPDSAGINPYVTVMALADRVAEGIRAGARDLLAVPEGR
ncbi:MAG: GMC family oxidoreductase [bacterium]|nr:GMC family oxidoreductase [bacterium]